MAYTDHPITAYVFPQDGASPGIGDPDADWQNAAYVGGLAKAQAKNYTPEGVDVTADFANNQFSITEGLSYIEDPQPIDFRDWDDSEINRSGTWTGGYLSVMHVKAESGIPFETTTGMNYVYLGWDRTSQNNAFVRVADDEADAPTIGVKIENIDAGASSSLPKNRVAGHNWNFVKKYSASGVPSVTLNVPEVYDEMRLKFLGVTGTATSSVKLQSQVNGTPNYYQRTTQGSNTQITNYWINHDIASRAEIRGEVFMSGRWDTTWSFDNRTTNRGGKYFGFSGWNDNVADNGELNEIFMEWGTGDITGEWNLWGRDNV